MLRIDDEQISATKEISLIKRYSFEQGSIIIYYITGFLSLLILYNVASFMIFIELILSLQPPSQVLLNQGFYIDLLKTMVLPQHFLYSKGDSQDISYQFYHAIIYKQEQLPNYLFFLLASQTLTLNLNSCLVGWLIGRLLLKRIISILNFLVFLKFRFGSAIRMINLIDLLIFFLMLFF